MAAFAAMFISGQGAAFAGADDKSGCTMQPKAPFGWGTPNYTGHALTQYDGSVTCTQTKTEIDIYTSLRWKNASGVYQDQSGTQQHTPVYGYSAGENIGEVDVCYPGWYETVVSGYIDNNVNQWLGSPSVPQPTSAVR